LIVALLFPPWCRGRRSAATQQKSGSILVTTKMPTCFHWQPVLELWDGKWPNIFSPLPKFVSRSMELSTLIPPKRYLPHPNEKKKFKSKNSGFALHSGKYFDISLKSNALSKHGKSSYCPIKA